MFWFKTRKDSNCSRLPKTHGLVLYSYSAIQLIVAHIFLIFIFMCNRDSKSVTDLIIVSNVVLPMWRLLYISSQNESYISLSPLVACKKWNKSELIDFFLYFLWYGLFVLSIVAETIQISQISWDATGSGSSSLSGGFRVLCVFVGGGIKWAVL